MYIKPALNNTHISPLPGYANALVTQHDVVLLENATKANEQGKAGILGTTNTRLGIFCGHQK